MQRYHNPFEIIPLVAPEAQREYYNTYCQTGTGRGSVDHIPFPRMVDLWFAGFSLAARRANPPVDLSDASTFEFIKGSVFHRDSRDSWRIQTIMLVAIAVTGDVDVLPDRHRVMAIANGLAAAGVPHIVDMLSDGGEDPIWNLSEALERVLKETSSR